MPQTFKASKRGRVLPRGLPQGYMSKLLGFLIIILSPLSKLPQIIKILRIRSVEGLNTMSYIIETFAYIVFFTYNYRNGYPFSTYGEVLFIYLQNLVVLLLVSYYGSLSSLQSICVFA